MMIFYFNLFYFTFSITYSLLSFHLVYVFQYLHFFLLFFDVLSQTFIKHSRKACVCVYAYSHGVAKSQTGPSN